MTNSKKTLSIIIPAFNEEKRIINALEDIKNHSFVNAELNEVIIVSDGSTDNTVETVNNWIKESNVSGYKVIDYSPNKGKGNAINVGFKEASSDLLIYTDADGASPIKEFEKLAKSIEDGAHIACGSRVLKGEGADVSMSIKRRFIGLSFHLILKTLGLAKLKDTQCGFKLFTNEAAKRIVEKQQCFNFSFDIEYLYLGRKSGFKINEVPINWHHVHGSKVDILRDSLKMLIEVFKIRFVYKY